MRPLTYLVVAAACLMPSVVSAHHPDRKNKPVRQYYDVIGPLGTRLPMSHRRKYNRPSNWAGKIAYYIAPSSQEAMAWHRADHKGYYENDCPRMITHYFYPKPWEILKVGARESSTPDTDTLEFRSDEEGAIEPETRIEVDEEVNVEALKNAVEELLPPQKD